MVIIVLATCIILVDKKADEPDDEPTNVEW